MKSSPRCPTSGDFLEAQSHDGTEGASGRLRVHDDFRKPDADDLARRWKRALSLLQQVPDSAIQKLGIVGVLCGLAVIWLLQTDIASL